MSFAPYQAGAESVSPPEADTPRVLVVAPFAPSRHATHGAGRAMGGLVAAMARRTPTAVVHVRADDTDNVDEAILDRLDVIRPVSTPGASSRSRQALGLMTSRPLWMQAWWSESLRHTIADTIASWRPDVVQVELDVMQPAIDIAVAHGVPSVFVVHEPAHSMGAASSRFPLVDRLDHRAWLTRERRGIEAADATVVFTERDGHLLAGRSRHLRVIPLGVDLEGMGDQVSGHGRAPDRATCGRDTGRPRVVFVGGGGHPPNVDAAERLVLRILPGLVAARPDVRLSLVGDLGEKIDATCPCPEVDCDHLDVLGFVDDVLPHLLEAAVVVAPLRVGGGMRVKVLDAMVAGAPIVASSLALAGLDDAVAAGAVRCADTDSEIVESVLEIIGNRARREELGTRAACWVRATATWDQRVGHYLALHRAITDRSPTSDAPR